MSLTQDVVAEVPDDIARPILSAQSHHDPDAFAAYAWLRRHAPVARTSIEGWDPFWLISRHADIMEVERQPAIFAAGGGPEAKGSNNPLLMTQAEDAIMKEVGGGSYRVVDTVLHVDPPEHSAFRDMPGTWFRPAAVRRLEPTIRAIASATVADTLKSGANEPAEVADFCVQFPLRLILSMLGLPDSDAPQLLALTEAVHVDEDDSAYAEGEGVGPDALGEHGDDVVGLDLADSFGFWDAIVDDRRANPREDLSTIISLAKDPQTGEYYPKPWAYGWLISTVTAGHDTSVATLAGILEQMAKDPSILETVRNDPSRIPALVEESLRWVSPVLHFTRVALEDYELGGQRISAGDRLVVLFQSANRDEEIFDRPDEFDMTRSPNPHIAFGYGAHQCIGQHLAKQELKVMLEELLPRVERVELVEGANRHDIRHLPDLRLVLS